MRTRSGVTLVELLVAGGILIVLLGMLGTIYVGTRRAYNTNEVVTNERQSVQAITELLQYEIGLAGYRCVDSATSVAARNFPTHPLIVSDGASGSPDTITVRYHEDRFTGGSCSAMRRVTYSVSDSTLWRDVGGNREAAVAGVVDLQVTSWLDSANTAFHVATASANDTRPAPQNLSGIGLTVVLEDETGRTNTQLITIGLKNPQCAVLADCL